MYVRIICIQHIVCCNIYTYAFGLRVPSRMLCAQSEAAAAVHLVRGFVSLRLDSNVPRHRLCRFLINESGIVLSIYLSAASDRLCSVAKFGSLPPCIPNLNRAPPLHVPRADPFNSARVCRKFFNSLIRIRNRTNRTADALPIIPQLTPL